jgi:hypothetical protein
LGLGSSPWPVSGPDRYVTLTHTHTHLQNHSHLKPPASTPSGTCSLSFPPSSREDSGSHPMSGGSMRRSLCDKLRDWAPGGKRAGQGAGGRRGARGVDEQMV